MKLQKTNNFVREQIVKEIHENTKFRKADVQAIVYRTINTIADALHKGHDVELRNLGTLMLGVHKGKTIPHFAHGKPIVMPTRVTVRFKLSTKLRKRLRDLDPEMLDPDINQ